MVFTSDHPGSVLPPRKVPRVGAFFDMDKTLIAENSGSLYMKYRYAKGEISSWELAKGLSAYLQYKLGILDIATWARGTMADFKGRSEAELTREASGEFAAAVLNSIYLEVPGIIQAHHAAGHVVAIVSGSTKFVIEPLAKHLGIEHMLYTRLEVENGFFTGRVIDPICFEEGKIYWLEQFIDEHEIDLAKSYFYTDSITDLPLLDLVSYPMVTNPDPLLYREAVRRHWPVKLFTAPKQSSTPGFERKPEVEKAARAKMSSKSVQATRSKRRQL